MNRVCKTCGNGFEITEDDLKFYDNVSPIFNGKKYLIPSPTLCPDCRQQRRSLFRNERTLFQNKCALCKKDVVSVYSPDKGYKVFCKECWWSDNWDPFDYGRNFDFNKPFFEQFDALLKEVPHPALLSAKSENCDFTHLADNNKNCYLLFLSGECEDVQYGYWLNDCKDCFDLSHSGQSELCFELTFSKDCYHLFYSHDCGQCRDGYFLDNCTGCNDCIMCSGLIHKSYYFNNKSLTKEEFFKKKEEFLKSLPAKLTDYKKQFREMMSSALKEYSHLVNAENCSGDYLVNCKNCHNCYSMNDCEDCKYCYDILRTKNTYDASVFGKPGELLYEINDVGLNSVSTLFTSFAYSLSNSLYCKYCFNTANLFGCSGIKGHKQFCILNKKYTKDEYENLVGKIIEYMQKIGEWGEFFDPKISMFGYNETVANEYFPLTKDQAVKKGFKWSDFVNPPPKAEKVITVENMEVIPGDISEIPDEIVNWALTCEVSGKLYKITKQELKFYKDHNLPIPKRHPDQRHKDRMTLINPRKLYDRKCMKCGADIKTTYSPQRPEIVYCEACYLKEVY